MFESLFNGRRKSLKEMMDELNEMMGDYNPNFRSSTEHKVETGNTDGQDWERETWSSPDGSFTYIVTTSSISPLNYRKNPKKETTVESLKKELDKAVENEDFQLAIYLRDKIKSLETNQDEIKALEDELKSCIEKQDFEKAIEIRDQLRKLKP